VIAGVTGMGGRDVGADQPGSSPSWIVLAMVAGIAVGVPLSRVPLTAVPQRTALSHAFGGWRAASSAPRSTHL
jgi:NAD(P) transhydrogenase subunit beta